jgi:nucleoid-associated protein YgaU
LSADRSAASPDITNSNAGLFRHGTRTDSIGYADFSQSTEAYNSASRGSGSGSFIVRAGDTLADIAQALYGDANLWYRLADANGLNASSSLVLPAGGTKSAHNAETFMPYDRASAMGDTQPTTP